MSIVAIIVIVVVVALVLLALLFLLRRFGNRARVKKRQLELRQRRREIAGKQHERGMADHELIADHERERFAETSVVADSGDGADPGAGGVGSGAGDEGERSAAYREGQRAADDPSRAEDFKAGPPRRARKPAMKSRHRRTSVLICPNSEAALSDSSIPRSE